MKRIIHLLCPPVFKILWHKLRYPEVIAFSGDYTSWEQAQQNCSGYDADEILEKVKQALLKVKNGEAAYERDSVVFEQIEYAWPVLTGLLMANNNNSLGVLDFGGSLGSSYYQNRLLLKEKIKALQWHIVEQNSFVECGRKFFQDEELKFHHDIASCANDIDVVLLSGVLSYVPDPFLVIKEVLQAKPPFIIVDRTPFLDNTKMQRRLAIQNVPAYIYSASYPAWFFQEKEFIDAFKDYQVLAKFPTLEAIVKLAKPNTTATFYGFILARIDS